MFFLNVVALFSLPKKVKSKHVTNKENTLVHRIIVCFSVPNRDYCAFLCFSLPNRDYHTFLCFSVPNRDYCIKDII